MLRSLISKELRDRKWSLLAYTMISVMFMVMYIGLFPSIKKESANYTQLFESMPKALSETFDIQASSFLHLESFLSIELFSITWPLLAALLAISRAGSSVTGEMEQGSMGMLLSLPVSRRQLLKAKVAAGALSIEAFVLASTLLAIPLAAAFGQDFIVSRYFLLALYGSLYALSIYAISLVIACAVSERSKVYFALGGGLVIMYTLNIISGLRSNLEWLQYASIFHYFNASDPLSRGQVSWASLAVFTGLIMSGGLTAFYQFQKRDIVV